MVRRYLGSAHKIYAAREERIFVNVGFVVTGRGRLTTFVSRSRLEASEVHLQMAAEMVVVVCLSLSSPRAPRQRRPTRRGWVCLAGRRTNQREADLRLRAIGVTRGAVKGHPSWPEH